MTKWCSSNSIHDVLEEIISYQLAIIFSMFCIKYVYSTNKYIDKCRVYLRPCHRCPRCIIYKWFTSTHSVWAKSTACHVMCNTCVCYLLKKGINNVLLYLAIYLVHGVFIVVCFWFSQFDLFEQSQVLSFYEIMLIE